MERGSATSSELILMQPPSEKIGSFETTEQVLHGGIKVYQSALPTKDEDRTVVFAFEHGTMIAIFDGHHSSELADFASKSLPQLIAERFDPTAADVDQVITQIFEDFDRSLILRVTKLFDPKEDWSGKHWDDAGNIHDVIGYGNHDPQFREARLAVVGTTVLIGIIDKEKKHIWVVSLGDSDAVRGRMQDGKLAPVIMSDRHNCSNTEEVERLLAAHPNEVDMSSATASSAYWLSLALKVQSRRLAARIMFYLYPSPIPAVAFEDWDRNGHLTPPYLSSSPAIRRHDLLPGDMLIFASDGLRDSMHHIPAADRWDIIISLANGEDHEQIGHACIRPEDGDNAAELLIKNVLFGNDPNKMAKELADRARNKFSLRDDISVVVVDLGWNHCT
ncbi:phosphatase 2C-like domain-containing protein [Mycena sp. CBHHK59/15]|nr:phosphatase 2C-like domain-containing protein [Mycena sp. CBHHK59/15]